MSEKNIQKYETYKQLFKNLSKSMKAEFYYEAIFIEYAILEDRLTSVLKYAGVPILDKNGNPWKMSQKITKIKSRKEFVSKFVRTRLSLELMDTIYDWKCKRDKLIHALTNMPYDSELVKAVAEEGYEIVRLFNNKSKSVINRFKRESMISQEVDGLDVFYRG